MWTCRLVPIDSFVQRVVVTVGGAPASYRQVIEGWRTDPFARTAFLAALSSAPFPSFRWECRSVTTASADVAFDAVIANSPELLVKPDPTPFAGQFDRTAGPTGTHSFPSLGGDAYLVVPAPTKPMRDFGHLAAFLRNASLDQQHLLWTEVASCVAERVSTRPLWLSTAGAGVSWLHVRLDTRPKYYVHEPFRRTA